MLKPLQFSDSEVEMKERSASSGTSIAEYVPEILRSEYAWLCSKGDSEWEIGDPKTAA